MFYLLRYNFRYPATVMMLEFGQIQLALHTNIVYILDKCIFQIQFNNLDNYYNLVLQTDTFYNLDKHMLHFRQINSAF